MLPIFFNGKLREYVDPTDGSVRFQVFDKDGNKVGPGVKVKGIPGLANQNKEFETDAEGKIKVLREDLPVRFAPGQRAGKAFVDLQKNGVFEETAPNILTPNRIFTRIKMEFAYLRQLYNSSWSRAFPNNFTVIHYKYERQVDDRWEEYPVGLPTPDTETVKILNHAQPIAENNVVADPEWGKSTLGILPYDKKDGKTHIFYRPVVLTASEIKAMNQNLDIYAEHSSGWLRDQWNMNKKYSWNNVPRYMSIRGVTNFYGETPIMDAVVHVPEIYAAPSLSKIDLKMQIKTGTTSLWGYLKTTDQELPEFYLKYNEPVGNLWAATKMAGSQLPQHTLIGIGMTKNWNGGGGSSYVAIKPKVYPTGSKFLLNDTYPGNFIGAYSYLTDSQGGVTLGNKDERVLQADWVPYRDSAFYKLVTDSNDLSNPGTIKVIDLFDKTVEIPVTKEDAPTNWVIVK
ncbi:hypothetical protein [Porphyromonas cangingivalis]|uniref:hypothetical protein n=1 Tax=Porphyromonas cangingivalis TaxID=36874 RepID=UPI000471CE36|nr:hypothetical protein [Porphyromonas cangingivalis]